MKRKPIVNRVSTWLIPILTWIFVGILWLVFTQFISPNSIMIPSPQSVGETFLDMLKYGYGEISFWVHVRSSFVRLFLSLLFAIVLGIPLGFLSGYQAWARGVIDSLVQFYKPIPPLAYYPLLIIWAGIQDWSKILLLFLAAFAPIYIACVSAIGKVRKDYLLSARSLGANQRRIFWKVIWPATLPEVFTGIRTAFGFAYSTLVAAEMTAATSGIGWMVMDASRYLRSDVMFVGIFIMGISGLMIDALLRYCENILVFWKGRG